jgi:hypothetical protein
MQTSPPASSSVGNHRLHAGGDSGEQDTTDVTSRFFAVWAGSHRETRPERDLCYSMILQVAQDIAVINKSRHWQEARDSGIHWCENPYSGLLSLAACIDVLSPDLLQHISPYHVGRCIIQSAHQVAVLEYPNSNLVTAKDRSPQDFLQKVFGHPAEKMGLTLTSADKNAIL